MNTEIVAAMRQVRQMMGKEIVHDERRVAALLADLLGNQYPGERRLLKELVVMGIPRMIAGGQVTEADLPAKATYIAQKYLWNEEATLEAFCVWYATLQPHDAMEDGSRPPIVDPPKTHTNSLGMEFVLIPAGTFEMGCNASEPQDDCTSDERPRHTVTISQPFELGKHEVTQAQWQAVMGNNPSHFKGDDRRPVENVSWDDIQEFIRKLNAKEGTTRYRLPTEAEWEYAARAGSTTAYSFGDDAGQLGNYAWYRDNSDGKPHPVGQKQPNAWGLHDMHGNVWEWVQDWYDEYSAGAVTDPQGPGAGGGRVLRGGGWGNTAWRCRSASRDGFTPGVRNDYYGFRLARSPEGVDSLQA